MLTREDVLKAVRGTDRPTAEVDVPAWGGRVKIRALTAAHLNAWAVAAKSAPDTSKLVIPSVIDASGDLVFGPEDEVHINARAAVELKPLIDAIFRLNGLDTTTPDAVAGN